MSAHDGTVTGMGDDTTDGTFPAGTAMLALGVWFVLSRVMERFAAENATAQQVAMLSGITGALLASVAALRPLLSGVVKSEGLSRVLFAIRALCVLPVCALVIAAGIGEPPPVLQWSAVVGGALTLFTSLVPAIVRARGEWLARVALGLLLVGEVIEQLHPVVVVGASPGSPLPGVFHTLGTVSEVCTLVGAPFALAWSIRASLRDAGGVRVRAFTPMPVLLSLLLAGMAASIPRRVTAIVAQRAFGTRFDLMQGPPYGASLLVLLVYLSAPVFLIGASAISIATVGVDRGAGARRSLGWLAVLFAGFGAARLAGPADPIRLVLVALAAVLLERSIAYTDYAKR